MSSVFRARQRLGKFRITKRLSDGPLANVYSATDTVLSKPVALKIPHVRTTKLEHLSDIVNEVRIAAKLEHESILSLYDANFGDDCFVIVMPLGESSLAERMERRMSNARAIDLALQALEALAYAHEQGVIHCDIKPENFILFSGNRLKLADFGFSKLSRRTVRGSGSGTIDYIAPEQAMGKPRAASDVFSLGLVLYRLFSGVLPEYPFDWPPKSIERVEARTNERFVKVLAKSLKTDPKKRFRDAGAMLTAARRALRDRC